MRALVTGAAGFIGSNLVDRLLAAGHQVVGVDNLSSGTLVNLEHAFRYNTLSPGRFIFLRKDIQAPEMAGIVAGSYPDVIFHLAAQVDPQTAVNDPQFDARSNVLGTINLCEASRLAGVRRIVYATSAVSRYAAQTTERSELLSPCVVAKLAGEMYLRAYADMYGLAPICLQLSNVYGPRQNAHGTAGVVRLLGSAMVTGELATVHRSDSAALDLTYIDDVVEAFVRAGCGPTELTGTYHITTGQHTTHVELCRLMSAYFDSSSAPIAAEDRSAEDGVVAPTGGKAKNELDWTPVVDLASGIRRTMHWLCGALQPEPAISVGA